LDKNFELKNSLITLLKPIKNNIIIEDVKTNPYKPSNNLVKKDEIEFVKPSFILNPDMLSDIKNKLKKFNNINNIINDDDIKSTEETYSNKINHLKKTIINPDKEDYYNIIKKNYLQEKGIIPEDLCSEKEITEKVKPKKIKKIKKVNNT